MITFSCADNRIGLIIEVYDKVDIYILLDAKQFLIQTYESHLMRFTVFLNPTLG